MSSDSHDGLERYPGMDSTSSRGRTILASNEVDFLEEEGSG